MLVLGGCSAKQRGPSYQTVSQPPYQDSIAAQRLNDQGLAFVRKGDVKDAERKFREALEKDLYYAPAHNNLGLTLLESQRHYEAAWEFDYAAKLMPHAPEPRQNLGLVYESLGHLDEAITEYENALRIDPQNAVAMRHLARTCVKADQKGEKLKSVLEKLLLVSSDQQWDVWVRGQLIRLGRADTETQPLHSPPD